MACLTRLPPRLTEGFGLDASSACIHPPAWPLSDWGSPHSYFSPSADTHISDRDRPEIALSSKVCVINLGVPQYGFRVILSPAYSLTAERRRGTCGIPRGHWAMPESFDHGNPSVQVCSLAMGEGKRLRLRTFSSVNANSEVTKVNSSDFAYRGWTHHSTILKLGQKFPWQLAPWLG